MITVDAVRNAVHTSMPAIVSDLTDLVTIPSVSASSHDQIGRASCRERVYREV